MVRGGGPSTTFLDASSKAVDGPPPRTMTRRGQCVAPTDSLISPRALNAKRRQDARTLHRPSQSSWPDCTEPSMRHGAAIDRKARPWRFGWPAGASPISWLARHPIGYLSSNKEKKLDFLRRPDVGSAANARHSHPSGRRLRHRCRSGRSGGVRTPAGVARPLAHPADLIPDGAVERRSPASAPAGGRHGGRTGRTCRRARRRTEVASVRGPFGNSIRWRCLRHGIGPGHKDWPELSRAIVAFGGSLEGFRPGAPAVRAVLVGEPRCHTGHGR